MSVSLSEFPVWVVVAVGVLALASIILAVIALLDLYRRPTEQVVLANKWIWVAIVLLVNPVGAIIYLAAGRKPAIIDRQAAKPGSSSVPPENIADTLYGPRDETGER